MQASLTHVMYILFEKDTKLIAVTLKSQSAFKIFAHVQDTYHQIPIIYPSRFNPLPIKVKIKINFSRLLYLIYYRLLTVHFISWYYRL